VGGRDSEKRRAACPGGEAALDRVVSCGPLVDLPGQEGEGVVGPDRVNGAVALGDPRRLRPVAEARPEQKRIGTSPASPSTRRTSSRSGASPERVRVKASVTRTVPAAVRNVVVRTFVPGS
jgi:hypothetical protein